MATDDRALPTPGRTTPTDLGVEVRLTLLEYGTIAAEYAPIAAHPDTPRAVVDDYAVVVDALALAHRVPDSDVPAVLAVGTKALIRVDRALLGPPSPRKNT
ncbi:hypothetical protein [Streptomyces sp. bgisy060]|uniref:hypothetical protein n=1 Tax=Streptomyces sp. bgisy060 TaxID=3413775 RepID=UPI003EB8854D